LEPVSITITIYSVTAVKDLEHFLLVE
jgi:hypothetical protein